MTRSSAGDTAKGAGSRCSTLAITAAALSPSNARAAGQHLVEHAPERKQIAARVHVFAFELLGRHILKRPDQLPLGGQCQRRIRFLQGCQLLCQSEIQKLDAFLGHQNIGRLQIAMDDALLVRGVQGIENLGGVFSRLLQRQRPFKGHAFDVFHHQVVRSHVVDLADVGMIQRRHGAGFALKALAEFLFGKLQNDDPVEPRIARLPYFPHASFANERNQLIGAEMIAGSKSHVQWVSTRLYQVGFVLLK